MADFIGVDWGTSSFRAYRIIDTGEPVRTLESDAGVAGLSRDEQAKHLREQVSLLQEPGENLAVIVCGMAGSSIGLSETAYLKAELGLAQLPQYLHAVDLNDMQVWIVPGIKGCTAKGEVDVMRGEETQILGCWLAGKLPQAACLCLPGTHSKWVSLQGDKVEYFNTLLSGELFSLLSNHSVLVQGPQQFCEQAFAQGIACMSKVYDVQSVLFSARSRVLLQQLAPEHAQAYLSGLLIASEVTSQQHLIEKEITLIGRKKLVQRYQHALQGFAIKHHFQSGTAAVIAGLHYCYQRGVAHA